MASGGGGGGNFLQGLAGGAAGTLGGGLATGLLGAIGGLFGLGQQHEDPALRQMRQQQQQIAGKLYNYGTSVPGSSPDELANLSQARGNLGQEQRANQQRAFANYNPSQGLPASQMLANLGNTNIAQQMAQQSSFLQNASANRRQALQEAANVGLGAASLYRPQQSQFPQVAGQLAQMLAYQQARNKPGAATAGATTLPTTQPGTNATPSSTPGMDNPGQTGDPNAPTGAFFPTPTGAPIDPAAQIQSLTGGPADGSVPGGAPGQPDIGQLLALLSQHFGGSGTFGTPNGTAGSLNPMAGMGGMGQGAAQGLQGSMSPGNEPFGLNGLTNQVRQSNMIPGIPTAQPGMMDAGQINDLLRQLVTPGGVRLNF